MRDRLSNLASLFVGVGLLALGYGLSTSLVGLRMALEGFAEPRMGVVASALYAGGGIAALVCNRLIIAVGHTRAFATLASLLAVTVLGHTLGTSPPTWLLLRAGSGFAYVGLLMAVESWLNEIATRETRGRLLASYTVVTTLALAGGQLLLNLYEPSASQLFVVSAMLFSLAVVPVAGVRSAEPQGIPVDRSRLPRLAALSPPALCGCLAAGLMIPALYGLGAVFAHGLGLDTRQISFFLAATILGGLVFQWPIGWASDLLDRRWVLLGLGVSVSVFSLGILAVSRSPSPSLLHGAAFLLGGALFPIYPVSVALANDHAEAKEAVEVSRGLLFVYSMGATVAPILCGVAMEWLGPPALFVQTAAVAAALALFAVSHLLRAAPAPPGERSSYVPVPQTSPAGSALDPRQPAA